MKHALCSLVLLVAMSTVGLLVGSKDTFAADARIADHWGAIHKSTWIGQWEGNKYGSSGRAEITLKRFGTGSQVRADFKIYMNGQLHSTYYINGKVYGNVIDLERRRSTVVLFLSEADGVLTLKGTYEVFRGPNAGFGGKYRFEKPE